MPISAPRTRRRVAASAPISSAPSKTAEPEIRAPRVRPVIVWVATLLPDPDSPTIAKVVPLATSNDSPRTARTTPSGVSNSTWRSRTSSSAISVGSTALLVLVDPDVRRVELLHARHVDRVVHLRRMVVLLLRVGDREEWSIRHHLLVSGGPEGLRLILGGCVDRRRDRRVGRRAVVEPEVAADGREGRLAGEQRVEEGQRRVAVPVRAPACEREVPDATLRH